MSFILDALRKSEHARQRQTGPGLAEVPVAPAKPKTNVWAAAAVALLVVNLLGVGFLLLRRAQKEEAVAAPATAAAATAIVGGSSGPAPRIPPWMFRRPRQERRSRKALHRRGHRSTNLPVPAVAIRSRTKSVVFRTISTVRRDPRRRPHPQVLRPS